MAPRPGSALPAKEPVAVLAGPVRRASGPALAKWTVLGRMTRRHVELRGCKLEVFSEKGARAPLLSVSLAGGTLSAAPARFETTIRAGGARVTLQWPGAAEMRACRAAFEYANRRIDDFYKIVAHRQLSEPARAAGPRSSEVVFAFDIAAGTHTAVKVVRKGSARAAELDFAEREVALRMTLRHPALVQTLDIFESPFDLFFVMEFMGGGTLARRMALDGAPLREHAARVVMMRLLAALRYLHRAGVAHRNVKPENILLDFAEDARWPGTAKLGDLSLAARVGDAAAARTLVGTPEFLAPEAAAVGRGAPPAVAVETDMWAAGVTLYNILSQGLPFDGADPPAVLRAVRAARFEFTAPFTAVSSDARSLIRALLAPDRRKRLTAASAMLHPWFAGRARRTRPPPDSALRAGARAVQALLRMGRGRVALAGARGGRAFQVMRGGVDIAPRPAPPAAAAALAAGRISNSSTVVSRSSGGSALDEFPPPDGGRGGGGGGGGDSDEFAFAGRADGGRAGRSRAAKFKRAVSFQRYEEPAPRRPGDAGDRKQAVRSTFSSHPALRLRAPARSASLRSAARWEALEAKSERKWRLRETWEARALQDG